jgi:hypothetical protein
VPPRIVLLVRIAPYAGGTAQLSVADVSTETPDLSLQSVAPTSPIAFLLTLEAEPDRRFSRGEFRPLSGGRSYPLRSSAAFFDLLAGWSRGKRTGPGRPQGLIDGVEPSTMT